MDAQLEDLKAMRDANYHYRIAEIIGTQQLYKMKKKPSLIKRIRGLLWRKQSGNEWV